MNLIESYNRDLYFMYKGAQSQSTEIRKSHVFWNSMFLNVNIEFVNFKIYINMTGYPLIFLYFGKSIFKIFIPVKNH